MGAPHTSYLPSYSVGGDFCCFCNASITVSVAHPLVGWLSHPPAVLSVIRLGYLDCIGLLRRCCRLIPQRCQYHQISSCSCFHLRGRLLGCEDFSHPSLWDCRHSMGNDWVIRRAGRGAL